MALLWYEQENDGRCWHVRTTTGLEIRCRSVSALEGETVQDGKSRRARVNHALKFDESRAFFLDSIPVTRKPR